VTTMIEKLVSGGQTGVDRAALDVALELGLPCGGWCPRGRKAEDGPIDERYPLRETDSAEYPPRTEANVRDSDATLILKAGKMDRGTALTLRLAQGLGKPCRVLDLAENPDPAEVLRWVEENSVRVLNVAGPRESSQPGIYQEARAFLLLTLSRPAPPAS
jgi:Circularly permutated YpsA SLOG family